MEKNNFYHSSSYKDEVMKLCTKYNISETEFTNFLYRYLVTDKDGEKLCDILIGKVLKHKMEKVKENLDFFNEYLEWKELYESAVQDE